MGEYEKKLFLMYLNRLQMNKEIAELINMKNYEQLQKFKDNSTKLPKKLSKIGEKQSKQSKTIKNCE